MIDLFAVKFARCFSNVYSFQTALLTSFGWFSKYLYQAKGNGLNRGGKKTNWSNYIQLR